MGSIHIRTPIPGPRSKEWLRRRDASVAKGIGGYVPVIVEHARGAVLTDLDGNTFIDLAGGIGSLNTGHAHPQVVDGIIRQAKRFLHTDFSLIPYRGYIELAEALIKRAPVKRPSKAAFFNSGAEAVENTVKIARRATGRKGVVAFEGGFHGRTLMALSLTSRVRPYKEGFGPFAPEVYRMPYPNPYRHPRPERSALECLEAVERAFVSRVSPDEVCAVVLEPVQGEGGFIVPPASFVTGLRELCDRHGILLIVDEIQSGYGRTGRFFALEHFGVEADLLTVGKSIASGLPLSAVVGSAEIMDAVGEGGIGGTTIGNPLACAAGIMVLQVMDRENLVERAQVIGRKLRNRFEALAATCPEIGEVRGLGAMVGVEFVTDRQTKEPAREFTQRAISEIIRRGVVVLPAGPYGNVMRFLVPLVIQDEELEEALDVIADVLS